MTIRIVEQAGRTRRRPPAQRERGHARARAPVLRRRRRHGRRARRRGGVRARGGRLRRGGRVGRRRRRSGSPRIVQEANRRIFELAATDESHRGMGTTLTAAMVHGDEISLGARRRQPRLPASRRHSSSSSRATTRWSPSWSARARSPPEAAENHPQRSIITRALGPEANVEVDTYTVTGRDGDLFLICSDGLTSMISDDEVAAILRAARSARGGGGGARARGEPERRQGQHHGASCSGSGDGRRR